MSDVTGIEFPKSLVVEDGQQKAGLHILGAASLIRVVNELPFALRDRVRQNAAAPGPRRSEYLGALAGDINTQSTDLVERLAAGYPKINPYDRGIMTYAYGLLAMTRGVVERQPVDEHTRGRLLDYARRRASLQEAARLALARVASQTAYDLGDIDQFTSQLADPQTRPDVAPGEIAGGATDGRFALALYDVTPAEPPSVQNGRPWVRFAYGTSNAALAVGSALEAVAGVSA